METSLDRQKRIAKNTVYLYIRMGISIVVGLYTSRIVLEALGARDFGIYNVVGGVVTLMTFINSAMTGATQRFLNFEQGRQEIRKIKNVYRTSLQLHLILSGIILVLGETVGVWFLNTHMNIEADKLFAANWVMQFSIIACVMDVMSVPNLAVIVSRERMSAFAYVEIVKVFLKLGIAFIILYSSNEKLILYAALMAAVAIAVRIVYFVYCKRNFAECRNVGWEWDKNTIKEMTGFSVWSIVGSLGNMSHTQGNSILINIYFGTIINATQGIANQINGQVSAFVGNFLTALNPQIVKCFSSGKLTEMHKLIYRGSRIAIAMVAMLVVPIFFATPAILNLWLTIIPPETVIFVRIILLITLVNSITSIMATSQGATGKIKKYQIVLTTIGLLHLPIAWIFFAMGAKAYSSMLVYLVIVIILQIIRINFVCHSVKMSRREYYSNVIFRCSYPIIIASAVCYFVNMTLPDSLNMQFVTASIGLVLMFVGSWLFIFTKYERDIILSKIKSKMK